MAPSKCIRYLLDKNRDSSQHLYYVALMSVLFQVKRLESGTQENRVFREKSCTIGLSRARAWRRKRGSDGRHTLWNPCSIYIPTACALLRCRASLIARFGPARGRPQCTQTQLDSYVFVGPLQCLGALATASARRAMVDMRYARRAGGARRSVESA